jgi:hypothetical protein
MLQEAENGFWLDKTQHFKALRNKFKLRCKKMGSAEIYQFSSLQP